MDGRPGWAYRWPGDQWRWHLDGGDAPSSNESITVTRLGEPAGPSVGFGFSRVLRDVVAIAESHVR